MVSTLLTKLGMSDDKKKIIVKDEDLPATFKQLNAVKDKLQTSIVSLKENFEERFEKIDVEIDEIKKILKKHDQHFERIFVALTELKELFLRQTMISKLEKIEEDPGN